MTQFAGGLGLLAGLGLLVSACGDSGASHQGAGGSPSSSGASGISGVSGSVSASGGSNASGSGGAAAGSGGSGAGAGGNSGTGGSVSSGGSGGMSTGGLGSGGKGVEAGGGGGTAGQAAGRGGAMSNAGTGGAAAGSAGTGAAGKGGAMGSGGAASGTCTKSMSAGKSASGSGSHDVVVETNSDSGINKGTIYRPADLGGDEKYPIFVWGEGACSQNGLSNSAAMAEIASHGYFVVADGTPNGSGNITMDRSMLAAMGAPLIAYIDWAIAENDKPCSAYYQSLDTTKIAANGFSCGGLMSQGTVTDPRIVTWGVTSSGMAGADQTFYDTIHTPVFFVEGGADDIAYDGGLEGYNAVAALDVPVMWFSKALGHGGDLSTANGGDFTKLNLAWLNWWLKGDETATGKGALVGTACSFCSNTAWEVKSAHLP